MKGIDNVLVTLQKSWKAKQNGLKQIAAVVIADQVLPKIFAPAQVLALTLEEVAIIQIAQGNIVEDGVDEIIGHGRALQQ